MIKDGSNTYTLQMSNNVACICSGMCAVYSKYSRIYGNVQGWRFHVNMYLVVYTLVPFDNAQLKPRA